MFRTRDELPYLVLVFNVTILTTDLHIHDFLTVWTRWVYHLLTTTVEGLGPMWKGSMEAPAA